LDTSQTSILGHRLASSDDEQQAAELHLVHRACRDGAAFAELYRRYLPRVYAYHLARSGNVEDAQDLTSQTFMAALENLPAYRGQGSFAAWLLTIAHHKLVDHYRRSRPQAALEAAGELLDPQRSPEEQTARRLDMQRISLALAELPAERAEALGLRVFGGLSAAEIGRLMGKSEAAVKMLVCRAFQTLRQRLLDRPTEEL